MLLDWILAFGSGDCPLLLRTLDFLGNRHSIVGMRGGDGRRNFRWKDENEG